MRFKSVRIKDSRRFTDLAVQGVPETARLILLAGPNGCGKSSFLDALHIGHQEISNLGIQWDDDYHHKVASLTDRSWTPQNVSMELHDTTNFSEQQRRKLLYVRTAYRNDPEFQVSQLSRMGDPLDHLRFTRMIDNDEAVAKNFQRLASQALEDVFDPEDGAVTLDEFKELVIGDIRTAFSKLFPDVELNSLGNPLEDGTFRFTKGTSKGFSFKNLSGGEKSAFDLILDLIVARRAYDDTLFCVDEPESHMNARLQAELLSVLYELIPEKCQLMLATHSIGMMRRARDIEAEHPGSVVFLDFGGRNFDEPQVIEPTVPDRAFWGSVYDVALADLSALVAPERVVICEGEPKNKASGKNYAHDAQCYENIFRHEFPETQFVPGGSADEVTEDRRGIAYALGVLTLGTEVVKLIDLDDRSPQQVGDLNKSGVRVLSRRNLESYLFSDEVLTALVEWVDKSSELVELLAKKQSIRVARSGVPADDLKPVSGEIYLACKQLLGLTQLGNDAKTFMRDTLAPLIKPGTKVYDELRRDIFGSDGGYAIK